MRDELNFEEIFLSRSEVNADTSRLEGLETAKFVPLEQSCNCATDDLSSDEIGIKFGQEVSAQGVRTGWKMTSVEEAEDEQEPILFWQ